VKLGIIILADDQGMRMQSTLPKALHPLAGRPMLLYAVENARAITDLPPVLVVGREGGKVRQVVGESASYVEQTEHLGTGHAVLQARPTLEGRAAMLLVVRADMPLLQEETLRRLAQKQKDNDGPVTILTLAGDSPHGLGRVVRDESGGAVGIAEAAGAPPEQPETGGLDAGVYCFDAEWLWTHADQTEQEHDLANLVGVAAAEGHRVGAVQIKDPHEALRVDTRVHLAEAEAALRRRTNLRWMEAGVTMLDPETTYIESEVTIGRDTVIWPNTILRGQTVIGSNCQIGPGSIIEESTIGDGCRVVTSVVEQATMERGSDVGPFSHLRPGAYLKAGSHVGNFGEIKNSTLGAKAKMGHFSYLGDAEVGAGANIGAGTVTCNFDGEQKQRTFIGEGAFIGSGTMLIAPLRVGKGARTGAGSVVTRDLPDGTLACGVPARVRDEG